MKTLKEEEEATKISIPDEIIEDILLRLPVKSLFRFKSVSKPWLSRISHSSFSKLHLTRATHRTALFFYACDYSTFKRYPSLMTLHISDPYNVSTTQAQHLNGLVFFTWVKVFGAYNHAQALVLNPSTHKSYKPTYHTNHIYEKVYYMQYFFGYDESRNEHKILMIRALMEPTRFEIMIFSMSSYSWRKIDGELSIAFNENPLHRLNKSSVCVNSVVYIMLRDAIDILAFDLRTEKFSTISTPQGVVPHVSYTCYTWNHAINNKSSVCVNSVVYIMLRDAIDILAFDLRTEKFSTISTPQGVVPHVSYTCYTWNHAINNKSNRPFIVKINGCIGVVCHDHVVESNEMHIWILQDYENSVWVKEIITFPKPWTKLDCPFPQDSVNMDEIIFSSSKLYGNVMSTLLYNKKTRGFKSLQFTLGHQFPCSETLRMDQIKCFVESMLPL